MAVLTPTAKMQFLKADGTPLVGGKLYTYVAGTTTPQATYTDNTGGSANTNPIILDSRGEANVWLGGAIYKFKLTDADDVEIWTVDYISAPTSGVSPALSGNVTIDTNSSSPALTITQTGTGYALRVQDSADPDTTATVIDNTGRLGVGTVSPSELVDISGGNLAFTSAAGTLYAKITPTNTETTFNADGARDLVFSTAGVERARAGASLGFSAPTFTATTSLNTDTISERTAAAGVTIDGVLLKDSLIGGVYRPITTATVVSSGASNATFGSIPSWVKRITVILSEVSMTNTSVSVSIQIGPAAGFETTGYTSSSVSAEATTLANTGSTTSHILMPSTATTNAAWAISGHAVFTNITGNTWVGSSSIFGTASATSWCNATSSKTLAGVLTQIRVQVSGGTFDAGNFNIFYE
jgi:hypothetical protein